MEENVGRYEMGPEFRECRGKFTILDAISPLKRRINHKRTNKSGKEVVGQEPYLGTQNFPVFLLVTAQISRRPTNRPINLPAFLARKA